ncbi:Nucleoporin NUP120 [Elsinoe australis]|uniref:Nucleoporin NUP120 n=1 Tax=Elsinoe australis TaxID=40998 RepID=A0A2P7YNF6_9PEZI|nr:Nucleoporin NUP120 [Elsinoe australis]
MASVIAPILYTEAPLNVEPTSAVSTFHISTESPSIFASRKRLRLDYGPAIDQDSFAQKHVATESSIFFRSKEKAPRSILWRVLEDSKVLELQCVDLIQDHRSTQESLLSFRLSFANAIRPNGVALSDSHSHDALEVFVLTTSNELFTFSLRRDLLVRSTAPSSSDFDATTAFKTYALSSFSFRHPYKLVALNDLELLVSLHDGSLLRLERRAGENGSTWRETFFHEGGWGKSLRGLIPWKGQNTVKYGNIDLSAGAAAEVEASPDGEHVFTVSFDHILKSWNAKTGKVGFQIDLMGEERLEGRGHQQYLIGPGQGTLLRVLDVLQKPDGDAYYCVVWSPKSQQFKFWAVRDADSQEYGTRDVQSDVRFTPPLNEFMGTNVWQLSDFDIKTGPGWRDTQLWLSARSGSVLRTFTLTFDLLASADDLAYAWKHQWAEASAGSLSPPRLASLPDHRLLNDTTSDDDLAISASDESLSFLLFPGRFTSDLLETCLIMYQKGIPSTTRSQHKDGSKSFQERLREAIAKKAKGNLAQSSDMASHASQSAKEWREFYGAVKYLHTCHADPISLALDRETGLCWSIRAEQIAPIRTCSEIEVYEHNEDLFVEQDEEWIINSLPLADFLPDDLSLSAARLFAAARSFRFGLSTYLSRSFSDLASTFALRDAEADSTQRSRKGGHTPLYHLYEQCDFAGEVGDDEFARLTESVQELGGLGELENSIFETLLDKLSEPARGQEREQALSRYGDKATIRGAQDTLIRGKETLLDILALVVFMSQDLESEEMSRGFRPMELYSNIVIKIREYDVLLWMASHVRTEQSKARRSSGGESLRSSQAPPPQPTMTILESIFIGDWQSMVFPSEPLSSLLTYWSRAWTFGPNLAVNYDGVTAHVMSNFIKHEDYHLAYQFTRFLPRNSWAAYLKGRLFLGTGDYEYAAASFRRSAEDLSTPSHKKTKPIEAADTANLISATQRELFNAGSPRFYMHCCSLFEAAKLHSHAAEFASLALSELDSDNDDALDSSIMEIDKRKRSMQDSPAAMRVDLAMEEIRLLKVSELKEDILSRFFTNSLQTNHYEAAFSALVKFTNPAIKRSSLTQLLSSLLNSSPSTLLSLPFPASLDSEVDATLLSLARKTLSSTSTTTTPQNIHLLYSYRISRDNYRGAAEGLYEYLQWLKSQASETYNTAHRMNDHSKADVFADEDEEESRLETDLMDTYLLLINALSCCGDEAWILAEPTTGTGMGKRRVVTLEDVRREYQGELDRRSEIAQGRFPLVGLNGDAGAMEVDVF